MSLSGDAIRPLALTLNPPKDGSKFIIGIVDTAVQPLGADLDQFILKKLSLAGDALTETGPQHGTAMYESILRALQNSGNGSTSAQFVTADVFGPNANTTMFDTAQGIVAVINNGATWVNVSLGGAGGSSILQGVIQQASDRGIAIFAPSGNVPTGQPVYPGAYPGVVAVTATSGGQIAPYANVAGFVDAAAPGGGVVFYGGNTYYFQGTSVSTAYATGTAVGLAEATGQSWSQIQAQLLKILAVPGTPGH